MRMNTSNKSEVKESLHYLLMKLWRMVSYWKVIEGCREIRCWHVKRWLWQVSCGTIIIRLKTHGVTNCSRLGLRFALTMTNLAASTRNKMKKLAWHAWGWTWSVYDPVKDQNIKNLIVMYTFVVQPLIWKQCWVLKWIWLIVLHHRISNYRCWRNVIFSTWKSEKLFP